jgi:hypothetical protein
MKTFEQFVDEVLRSSEIEGDVQTGFQVRKDARLSKKQRNDINPNDEASKWIKNRLRTLNQLDRQPNSFRTKFL